MDTEEARRAAEGKPYVDDEGALRVRITAPTPPAAYTPITEYPGDVIGLAVIWSGPGGHEHGLRVWDSPAFGRDLGLTDGAAYRVFVPVVPEEAWWAHRYTGRPPGEAVRYVERYSLWLAAA